MLGGVLGFDREREPRTVLTRDATGNQIAGQTLPQDDDAAPQRLSQIAEVDVRVTPPAAAAPWYQGSVFYELYVRSFQDSTGDGHGDLAGLTSRLDYLNDGNPATTTDLGVDALWLMPVFESPSTHGYDTTDYESIESDYEAKRAPMAWNSTSTGGFTSGTPWAPFGAGQATANVASQTSDPDSLSRATGT